MPSGNMTVAALGRSFALGMLYDARSDKLIPGLTLWDEETIKKNTQETSQRFSKGDISKSDSTESKSFLMDINASLKASFLSGLVEIGGSAKYLNDTKEFKNQSRVTIEYRSTSHTKTLPLVNLQTLDTKQKNMIENGSATHVVTGITYGANAFFVFDSEKLEDSSVQDIQGSMEAVIKKIPSVSIEGSASVKLTDEEKDVASKLSCKFHGDFRFSTNPVTYEDALKTYVELPKLLGEKGENSVPMKVDLLPLTILHSRAPELKREISVGLVRKVQDALADLEEIKRRCNDSLVDSVVQKFPPFQEELNTFQNQCHDYKTNLKQIMKQKFPLIRGGTEDERSVEKLFEDRDKSPFSKEELREWMDHKEREINVIRFCVGMMETTKIFKNQSDLEEEVFSSRVHHALCLVFTSLESADPCLDAMAKYLKSPEECVYDEHWYSNKGLIKLREKTKVFHDMAKALENHSQFRFLVAVIPNEKYAGATIYYYKDGSLITDDFSKPDIPPVETITDKRDLIWYATDLTLDPKTTNYYLHLSEKNKKVTCGTWKYTYRDDPERFDTNPQVLCREELTGRHYWEVEWSIGDYDDVGAAVAYKRMSRKGGESSSSLGLNNLSWYFGHSSGLYAWHDGKQVCGPLSPADYSRVGVFLDHRAGTLSFYTVLSNTLSHLYTFRTTFTEPVHAAFLARRNYDYVYLNLSE